MDTFRSAASAGFAVLAKQYATPGIFNGNFWFGGNSLRTCLRYLLVTGQPDSTKVLQTAYDVYKDAQSDPNWWRDDYGWWGMAFLDALNNRSALGYSDPSNDPLFSDILRATGECWNKLKKNWRKKPYPGAPTIVGGVFNTTQKLPLAGRNSVTNEGFWLLSQGLAALEPGNPNYASMAAAEHDWFEQWMKLPPGKLRKNGILNEDGLVLERPLGNPDDLGWHWSGDQGLLLSAQAASGDVALATSIAQAVIDTMVDRDHVLHEYLGFVHAGFGEFIADYATGKGIFMRNLANFNLNTPGQPYSDFIRKNAIAVWCTQLGNNQFGYNWNPSAPNHEPRVLSVKGKSKPLCYLIMQTAGQDALNAAFTIAADEEIRCAS